MQQTKKELNTNPVGANCVRPHFEENTLKNQKGITLIALIITIIVMLILVGVTINVALNGGLFQKAEYASEQMQIEAEKENLSLAAIAAWEVGTGVDFDKMELPEGFSGSAGTYTSSKSGKTYKVDKATAKVTESGAEEVVADDLAYMKAELEGKEYESLGVFDEYDEITFHNTKINFVGYAFDFEGNVIGGICQYNGNYFGFEWDDLMNVAKVEINNYAIDINDNYYIGVQGTNVSILGLTSKGLNDITTTKKVIIPEKITGINGVIYNVTKIAESAFMYKKEIETLVIPNTVNTIGLHAFADCTGVKELILPSSVENLAQHVFGNWTSEQTIYIKGKTEEPVTTDPYSGIGWERNWNSACAANIVWDN